MAHGRQQADAEAHDKRAAAIARLGAALLWTAGEVPKSHSGRLSMLLVPDQSTINPCGYGCVMTRRPKRVVGLELESVTFTRSHVASIGVATSVPLAVQLAAFVRSLENSMR